ncbi:MAG: hypothetical protein ACYCUE_06795 [Steroidobacteraceae bacterium]
MHQRIFIATVAIIGGLAIGPAAHASHTVLTITCDAAKGIGIVYGVDLKDRLAAIQAHRRIPNPKLYPPHKDGFAKTVITLQSNGMAEVTYEWPQKLGGVTTLDMRMLGWLNEFAITLIYHGASIGPTDADLITFYPHESVAFFSGNDYVGFAGRSGRAENELTGYTYFARCHYNGLATLREAEASFYKTAHPLLR